MTDISHLAAFFLACLGAACIYAGYRLFCDLPVLQSRPHANRVSVVLMNVIPGLLLALLGTALITTEARAMLIPTPSRRQHLPAAEGTSWHPLHPPSRERSNSSV